MTKLIRAAVFVLALSVCAQAGVMQADKAQPTPSPTTTSATQHETEPATDDIVLDDLIVAARDFALSLLENLLTLF